MHTTKNDTKAKREPAAPAPAIAPQAATAPPAHDERTDAAIGLDETVTWLRERGVADRMPEGPASQVAPSSAAAAASELGRRIEATVQPFWDRLTPRQPQDVATLKRLFVRLPKAILDYQPNRSYLDDLRALIDLARKEALDEIANPTPPPTPDHPSAWVELARDFGLKLPFDRAGAQRELVQLFTRLVYENPRAASALDLFAKHVLYGDAESTLARWMRIATIGHGFKEPRRDDKVYAAAPPALPALLALPPVEHAKAVNDMSVTRLLEAIAPLLGFNASAAIAAERRVDPKTFELDKSAARKLELQRKRDRRQFVPYTRQPGTHEEMVARAARNEKENREAYEAELAKLVAADKAAVQALGDDVAQAPVRALHKVVGVIDRRVGELEKTEPFSLRTFWLRDVRHAIAGHRPLFMPDAGDVLSHAVRALQMVAALGLRIEVGP